MANKSKAGRKLDIVRDVLARMARESYQSSLLYKEDDKIRHAKSIGAYQACMTALERIGPDALERAVQPVAGTGR